MARGSGMQRMTGRDLGRLVTLLIPASTAPRMSRGVRIRGTGTTTFNEVQVKAKRISTPGSEVVADGRFTDTELARWVIAWRSDVDAMCQLRDDTGQVWNIKGTEEIDRMAFMALRCEAASGR